MLVGAPMDGQSGPGGAPELKYFAQSVPRMKVTFLVAFVPLLASCASSGLYNMSDEWCDTHLRASVAHCPDDPAHAAINDRERVAKNDARRND